MLYIIIGKDRPNSLADRLSVRPAHLDRVQASAQMPPRFRDQRIVARLFLDREKESQIDGMANRHGGHARHDLRHRPAVRHDRTGKGRIGVHTGTIARRP